MDSIITYLLQVNLLLTLIFLGYRFLLKNLTFYHLNRVYLLFGSLYAFVYPFLDLKSWFGSKVEVPVGEVLSYLPIDLLPNAQASDSWLLSEVLVVFLALGGVFLFFKFLIQLLSLLRIHRHSEASSWREYLFRNVVFPIAPFSFFNKIYIHREQHQEGELYDIFKHEHIHVEGHHTWDVLWFEMVLISCWFNPFVWFMRKAVRQNLEFLTDQQVLDKGVDRQSYQYSLLHVTKQGAQVGISNQFNFKTLKKRIMMMNKKRSSKLELSKYAFLLPVFLLAGASFTVNKAEAKIEKVVETVKSTDLHSLSRSLSVNFQQQDTSKASLKANEEVVVKGRVIGVDFAGKEVAGSRQGTDSVKNRLVGEGRKELVVRGKPSLFRALQLSDSSKRPIVILDGQRMPADFDASLIDTERIDKVVVVNGEHAKPYGLDGKEAALVITSKQKREPNVQMKIRGLSTEPDKIFLKVDDVVMPYANASELNPNQIHSMQVLKNPEKLKELGAEGKEAAILIETKEYAKKMGRPDKPIAVTLGKGNLNTIGRGMPDNVLYILNGKEVQKAEFEALKKTDINSIDVLKGEQAVSAFGARASEGVIRITTKTDEDRKFGNINRELHSISVRGRKGKGWDDYPKGTYFIVDGKPSSLKKVKELNRDDIKQIDKLGGNRAVTYYGDKAKDGAVVISTKGQKK
ncbi:M56 family metallopeptidase [Sphingobacterium humi]|uniref:Peptidase M56 domain-containing protein n=1 Tax=Sphingobacterium humi TaxID=1796905 RepID=A0A6N8L4M5_9SPHI|nr:M56 family metallopeptidase [Sphingobacterium humi]MVZ63401.1 hypothetical protein [Sphingobacterium humi]